MTNFEKMENGFDALMGLQILICDRDQCEKCPLHTSDEITPCETDRLAWMMQRVRALGRRVTEVGEFLGAEAE